MRLPSSCAMEVPEEPMHANRKSKPAATTSQIRQIAGGVGVSQKQKPRHSQQYQLHAPVRPTDGSAELPPVGLGRKKGLGTRD
jgi:hypothetical protein